MARQEPERKVIRTETVTYWHGPGSFVPVCQLFGEINVPIAASACDPLSGRVLDRITYKTTSRDMQLLHRAIHMLRTGIVVLLSDRSIARILVHNGGRLQIGIDHITSIARQRVTELQLSDRFVLDREEEIEREVGLTFYGIRNLNVAYLRHFVLLNDTPFLVNDQSTWISTGDKRRIALVIRGGGSSEWRIQHSPENDTLLVRYDPHRSHIREPDIIGVVIDVLTRLHAQYNAMHGAFVHSIQVLAFSSEPRRKKRKIGGNESMKTEAGYSNACRHPPRQIMSDTECDTSSQALFRGIGYQELYCCPGSDDPDEQRFNRPNYVTHKAFVCCSEASRSREARQVHATGFLNQLAALYDLGAPILTHRFDGPNALLEAVCLADVYGAHIRANKIIRQLGETYMRSDNTTAIANAAGLRPRLSPAACKQELYDRDDVAIQRIIDTADAALPAVEFIHGVEVLTNVGIVLVGETSFIPARHYGHYSCLPERYARNIIVHVDEDGGCSLVAFGDVNETGTAKERGIISVAISAAIMLEMVTLLAPASYTRLTGDSAAAQRVLDRAVVDVLNTDSYGRVIGARLMDNTLIEYAQLPHALQPVAAVRSVTVVTSPESEYRRFVQTHPFVTEPSGAQYNLPTATVLSGWPLAEWLETESTQNNILREWIGLNVLQNRTRNMWILHPDISTRPVYCRAASVGHVTGLVKDNQIRRVSFYVSPSEIRNEHYNPSATTDILALPVTETLTQYYVL